MKTLIIEKATEEIEAKSFGLTEQFLEIHQLVYDLGKPKIARIDREKEDGVAIVYFPVKDEKFYFSVYVDTKPEVSVRCVRTESYNSVSFCAFSDTLDFNQLAALTILKPLTGWNKGDKRGSESSNVFWKNSKIFFEPNIEADEFEDKLKKLLDLLENDKDGVKQLIDKANGYVQVAIEFHNGNTMLGGVHLDKEHMKRLADLNLEIDFDLYVGGNFFK